MQQFKTITSAYVPFPIENADIGQIIPARFLKATTRNSESIVNEANLSAKRLSGKASIVSDSGRIHLIKNYEQQYKP